MLGPPRSGTSDGFDAAKSALDLLAAGSGRPPARRYQRRESRSAYLKFAEHEVGPQDGAASSGARLRPLRIDSRHPCRWKAAGAARAIEPSHQAVTIRLLARILRAVALKKSVD